MSDEIDPIREIRESDIGRIEAERDAAVAREAVLRDALIELRDYAGSHENLQAARGYPPSGYARQLGERLDAALANPSPAAEELLAKAASAERYRAALEQQRCECDTRFIKKCLECGAELLPVIQGQRSALNSEQYDSVKAGDFYCSGSCKSDAAVSGKLYFRYSQLPETTVSRCLRCAALAEPAPALPAAPAVPEVPATKADGVHKLLAWQGSGMCYCEPCLERRSEP